MADQFDAQVYLYRPRSQPTCSTLPPWLDALKTNGTSLSRDAVWRQAGRHFSDSLNPVVVGFNGTRRQLATETAWRLVSMLSPSVDANARLVLEKPNDPDIQRLAMEILGVGAGLELLRRAGAIDGRTLRKVSSRFDFEGYSLGGTSRARIELKGSLNAASRQEHRASIQKKINFTGGRPRKRRSYDRWIGVTFFGWTDGRHPGVDFEIADPAGRPSSDPVDALAGIAEFYARTYELVGVRGAEQFWSFSRDPGMNDAHRRELFAHRGVGSPFSRVSIELRLPGREDLNFGGSFWRSAAVPFNRELVEHDTLTLNYCFVGVDKRVPEAMAGDEPDQLLGMRWEECTGTFDAPIPGGILVPEGSREDRFRGVYYLTSEGLIYVWSNVIPMDALVDARNP